MKQQPSGPDEKSSSRTGIAAAAASAAGSPSDTRDPDRDNDEEEEETEEHEGQHHPNADSLWGRAMTLFTTIWRGDTKEGEEEEKEEGPQLSHGTTLDTVRPERTECNSDDDAGHRSRPDDRRVGKSPPRSLRSSPRQNGGDDEDDPGADSKPSSVRGPVATKSAAATSSGLDSDHKVAGMESPSIAAATSRHNSTSSATNNTTSHTTGEPRPTRQLRRRRGSSGSVPSAMAPSPVTRRESVQRSVATDNEPQTPLDAAADSVAPAKRPTNNSDHPPPNTFKSAPPEARTEDSATASPITVGPAKWTRKRTAAADTRLNVKHAKKANANSLRRQSAPTNAKDPATQAVPTNRLNEETLATHPTSPIPQTRPSCHTTEPSCTATGEEEAIRSTIHDPTKDDSNSPCSNGTVKSPSKSSDLPTQSTNLVKKPAGASKTIAAKDLAGEDSNNQHSAKGSDEGQGGPSGDHLPGGEPGGVLFGTMGATAAEPNSAARDPINLAAAEVSATGRCSSEAPTRPCEDRQNVAVHPGATLPSCPQSQATMFSAPVASTERSTEPLTTSSNDQDRDCSPPAASKLKQVDGDAGSEHSTTGCQAEDSRCDKDTEDDSLDLIERFKRRPRRAAPQAYFFDMIPENVYDESSEEEMEIESQKLDSTHVKKSSVPLSSSKAASAPKRSHKKKTLSSEHKTKANMSSKSKAGPVPSKPPHQTASKSSSVPSKSARKPDLSSQQQKQSTAVKTPSKLAISPPAYTPAKSTHPTPPNTAKTEANAPPSSSRCERLQARRSHLSKVCVGREIAGPAWKRPNETPVPGTAPDQRTKKQKKRESPTSLSTAKTQFTKSKSSETIAATRAGVALLGDSSTPGRGAGATNDNQDTGWSPEERNSPDEDDTSPIVKAVLVTTPPPTATEPPSESSGTPGDLTNSPEFEARSSSMVSDVAVSNAPPPDPTRDSTVPVVGMASRETNVRPQIPMPRSNKHIPRPSDDARATLATSASTGEAIYAARQRMGVDVLSAAVSVASALKDGPWPSPCRSLLPEAIAARESNPYQHMDSHEEHMTIVGAALIQYARDVIIPSFLVAQDNGIVDSQRVVVGTMVLLREALVMNAGSIFRIQPEVMDISPDEYACDRQTKTLFVTKILATSIILYALESLAEESTHLDSSNVDSSASLEQEFLRAVKAYDGAEDEFLHFAARPLRDSEVPILPCGAELDERERRAWQLTVNVQRSRHALLQLGPYPGDETSLPPILPVEPTVAHVTVLEEQRG